MRRSSRSEKRFAAPPDGNDPPVSGALSNSSRISDNHSVSDYSLAELQRKVHESELLRQVAIKTNQAATAGEAIQACLEEVCAHTGWPVGHTYVPATNDTGELETTKLWHIDDPERFENFRHVTETTRYTSDQGLPSRVMAKAAPQWMVADTTYQHFPRAKARIEAGLKSGFAFPAVAGEAVVAVMEFFSPEVIEPDQQFLSVTAEIGILMGQVIERKQAEELRSASEARLAGIVNIAPEAVISIDAGNRIGLFNQGAEAIFGYTAEEITGQPLDQLLPTRFREGHGQRIGEFLRSPGNSRLMGGRGTIYGLRKDGTEFPAEASISKLKLPEETILTVILRDISDRVMAEQVLRNSEEVLRDMTSNVPGVVYQFKIDAQGQVSFPYVSTAIKDILGLEPTDIVTDPDTWFSIIHPDDRPGLDASIEESHRTLNIWLWEGRMIRGSGEIGWFRGSSTPRKLDDGSVLWNGLVLDISDQKQGEQALSDSETRYQQLAEMSPDGMYVHIDGEIVFANASLARILAVPSPEDFLGTQSFDFIAPEHRERAMQRLDGLKQGKDLNLEQFEYLRPDGSRVFADSSATLVTWNNTPAVLVLIRDISERLTAEKALVESRDQLRLVTDNLPVLIAYFDAERRYRFVNRTGSEWLARPEVDIIGKAVSEVLGQEYEKIQSRVDMTLDGDQQTYVDNVTYPDGVTRIVRATHIPHFGATGTVQGYFSLVEDITGLQQAEEALRQAQKMEAVGQLTGGVAHDFNNLLAVIIGNAELLGDKTGDDQLLATISRAATRGAELTQRLLTFSRQQMLAPQSIDLTGLISGLRDLLQRTLGEPVKIMTDIPEAIWPITADPGQLENALLNLSINARDAMPGGGILQIKCENVQLQDGNIRVADEVPEGDYVQIAVSDTGTGMSEDVLEHVFEPFYTTKEVGEGSGLGLSMVFGFARQSGGDVIIESTPGMGTEVRIFLPRSEVTTASDKRTQDNDLKRGQGEVILVLEDDPDVRSLAVAALDGLGYRVLEAADANAAMQVLEKEADSIDLLLSDVVLPGGVGGPEFAIKAKDLYPTLKIVFMTGYAAGLDATDEIPEIGDALLNKPFRRADLAKVIHETLTT